jgi:parallel beta-helix repeat protein
MVERLRAYYLIQGAIVKVLSEESGTGMAKIRIAGITIDLWTFRKFLSWHPVKDACGSGIAVVFANDVVSSTVRNCTFTESDIGIRAQSAGGNRYTNNTFTNVFAFLVLLSGQNIINPVVLDDSRFEAPASN